MDNEEGYSFGSVLRFLRNKHDITQRTLAGAMGHKSNSLLSHYEKEKTNPSYNLMHKAAKVLNLKVSDIVLLMEEFDDIPLAFHERIGNDAKWYPNKKPKQIYQTYLKG
jgi:transcriptional regulator with XRE-family HTH domain